MLTSPEHKFRVHKRVSPLARRSDSASRSVAGTSAGRRAPTNLPRRIVRKGRPIPLPAGGLPGRRRDRNHRVTASDAEERKYRVLSKGNENTIVMVTEPASERGQIMLMKGRDLWIFLPSVSQPVRLSTGAAAYRSGGQRRSRARQFRRRLQSAGCCAPKCVDGEKYHVLELTAVDRGVTYQRVIYWVRQVEQLAAQGRVLFAVRVDC